MNNYPDGMKEEDLDRYMSNELDEEEDNHEDVEPDYDYVPWDEYDATAAENASADRWYRWLCGPEG